MMRLTVGICYLVFSSLCIADQKAVESSFAKLEEATPSLSDVDEEDAAARNQVQTAIQMTRQISGYVSQGEFQQIDSSVSQYGRAYGSFSPDYSEALAAFQAEVKVT